VRKVPVVLFSYTQKAFTNPFKRALTRWLMSYIQRIYCVSEVDREHLLPVIGSQTVEVLGDTRYDQVIERLKNPKPIVDVLRPRGVPVLVAGSTWPADEAVLLPALAPLLKAGRIKLILVPHEPTNEHLEALRLQLQKLGLNSERFSLQQSWDDKPVLLVDQVGFLAELYLWGDYAFVGGSFRKSVHSVMEALGAGALTFVGPFHHNNREALEFKNLQVAQHPALEVVSSSEELRERLTAALDSLDIRQFHQALRQEFHRRLGASGKLVNQIEDLLRS
jgi:3-deoxy-D-manno-octulosonic-acid transferase